MGTFEPSQLELASASSEWSRPPLSSVTNSPPQSSTLSQCKRVRRKSSLIRRIDSSEDISSSHESIFHAERFSSTNSEDNDFGSRPEITPSHIITPIASITAVENNGNIRDQILPPIIGNTPILYGHGTTLTTIVEQKSSATMSTKVSAVNAGSSSEVSLARTSIPNLLGHRNSFDLPSRTTLRSPRRRKSFSADDLVFIKRSYHEACVMIERRTGDSLQIHDIYAEPRMPISPPIERPPTPPGMPSWTAAQNRPAQHAIQPRHFAMARSHNRLQRFLGIRPSTIGHPSRIPIPVGLQHSNHSTQVVGNGRSASSSLPIRVAPHFRPPRSGHGTGPLESHPFHHSGRSDAKCDAIPATPQAQTSDRPSCTQPGAPQRAINATRKDKRKWVRCPHVVGRPQICSPNAFASRSVRSRHHDVPAQCPHRRGQHASLRSLNQDAEVVIPDQRHLTVNYTLLASHDRQGNPVQQPILSTNVTEPQAGVDLQATASPIIGPVMTGAVPFVPPTAASPIKTSLHRCWKCHVSAFVSNLDDTWETSTSWCCWVFCGVDLHDDGESQGYSHGSGAQSGYTQGSLGPRRVVLDGMPVMLY